MLNFQEVAAALDTELSSGYVGGDTTGWRILWVCFDDYGLNVKFVSEKAMLNAPPIILLNSGGDRALEAARKQRQIRRQQAA